jgi:hypothetical protein
MQIGTFLQSLTLGRLDRRQLILKVASLCAALMSGSSIASARGGKTSPKPVRTRAPGWYRNIKATTASKSLFWIGHYVKPSYAFQHRPKQTGDGRVRLRKPPKTKIVRQVDPGRRTRPNIVKKPSGRISGAFGIKVGRLIRLGHDELPKCENFSAPRLNLKYYSEGVETLALEHWRAGRWERAVDILRVGLTYAQQNESVNIRLYDLLAGFLVRAGRETEILLLQSDIMQRTETLTGKISSLNKMLANKSVSPGISQRENALLEERLRQSNARLRHLNSRLKSWTDDDGKWREKWRPGAKRKWAGIDI